MMQPRAISASNSSRSASACSNSGTSSAPGTSTWWMLSSCTPSLCSSARQAAARVLVMLSLKRACTMPMCSLLPSSFSPVPCSAPNISIDSLRLLLGDVARDLQAVAHHAGHAPRLAHELHAYHAHLAQDLRADAVGAQIHAAALGRLGGAR